MNEMSGDSIDGLESSKVLDQTNNNKQLNDEDTRNQNEVSGDTHGHVDEHGVSGGSDFSPAAQDDSRDQDKCDDRLEGQGNTGKDGEEKDGGHDHGTSKDHQDGHVSTTKPDTLHPDGDKVESIDGEKKSRDESEKKMRSWGTSIGIHDEDGKPKRVVTLDQVKNVIKLKTRDKCEFNIYVSLIDDKHPRYLRKERGNQRWRMRYNIFADGVFMADQKEKKLEEEKDGQEKEIVNQDVGETQDKSGGDQDPSQEQVQDQSQSQEPDKEGVEDLMKQVEAQDGNKAEEKSEDTIKPTSESPIEPSKNTPLDLTSNVLHIGELQLYYDIDQRANGRFGVFLRDYSVYYNEDPLDETVVATDMLAPKGQFRLALSSHVKDIRVMLQLKLPVRDDSFSNTNELFKKFKNRQEILMDRVWDMTHMNFNPRYTQRGGYGSRGHSSHSRGSSGRGVNTGDHSGHSGGQNDGQGHGKRYNPHLKEQNNGRQARAAHERDHAQISGSVDGQQAAGQEMTRGGKRRARSNRGNTRTRMDSVECQQQPHQQQQQRQHQGLHQRSRSASQPESHQAMSHRNGRGIRGKGMAMHGQAGHPGGRHERTRYESTGSASSHGQAQSYEHGFNSGMQRRSNNRNYRGQEQPSQMDWVGFKDQMQRRYSGSVGTQGAPDGSYNSSGYSGRGMSHGAGHPGYKQRFFNRNRDRQY